MNFFGKELPVFKANLHTHTNLSDGGYTAEEIIDLYSGNGYDVLAFTDHRKPNKVSSFDGKGMTLISGIELHPDGPRGIKWHLLGLNVPEDLPGEYNTADDAVTAVLVAGGIVFCAHPHWCGLTSQDVLRLHGLSGIEVYNTSCRFIGKDYNDQCWDELTGAGFIHGALAVDDTHSSCHLFGGWTMIAAEDKSVPSIMNALAQGNYYATQGPEFYSLELEGRVFKAEFSEAVEVNLIGINSTGVCITAPDYPNYGDNITLTSFERELPPHIKGVVRCRIRNKEGKYAWTPPVIVE